MDYAATRTEALARIAAAGDLDSLERLRVEFLGKQGSISALLKSLGGMSADERQAQGPQIHALREWVTTAIADAKTALESAALETRLAGETLDLTLPAAATPRGSIHPVSQVMDELAEIFADMGFAVATGPEIEDDWHNFTALNMPESHPARAMHDTFYFPDRNEQGEEMLLRTHTSPVQIRAMKGRQPPIRVIAAGKVYRSDSDQTHTPMFHQVEGLLVDETSSFADLKGTLAEFVRAFFERDFEMRFRPSYFPFTEPSAEVDIRWDREDGSERWLEVLGCGMVHPNVLRNCGIDAEKYTGFAFGLGVERFAMLRYGVDDLRLFFENDVRFLRQFA